MVKFLEKYPNDEFSIKQVDYDKESEIDTLDFMDTDIEGFDSYFTITSSLGWFTGALIMYYGDQKPYSYYLNKLGW